MSTAKAEVSVVCHICNEGFASREILELHKIIHNSGNVDKSSIVKKTFSYSVGDAKPIPEPNSSVVFRCNLCDISFLSRLAYREHYVSYHLARTFACILCKINFHKKRALDKHIQKDHPFHYKQLMMNQEDVASVYPQANTNGAYPFSDSSLTNKSRLQTFEHNDLSTIDTSIIIDSSTSDNIHLNSSNYSQSFSAFEALEKQTEASLNYTNTNYNTESLQKSQNLYNANASHFPSELYLDKQLENGASYQIKPGKSNYEAYAVDTQETVLNPFEPHSTGTNDLMPEQNLTSNDTYIPSSDPPPLISLEEVYFTDDGHEQNSNYLNSTHGYCEKKQDCVDNSYKAELQTSNNSWVDSKLKESIEEITEPLKPKEETQEIQARKKAMKEFFVSELKLFAFRTRMGNIICNIEGKSSLTDFGFPNRNCEQVLIKLVEDGGSAPCVDVRIEEKERFRTNLFLWSQRLERSQVLELRKLFCRQENTEAV